MTSESERRTDERRLEERRSGKDRRETNGPLPGKVERRKLGDARKQPVAEVELSEAEWEKLFGDKTLNEQSPP
jgi:hypothetical protein